MTFFCFQVLVWSHLCFVLGAGSALIMKLLIGLTMGNGMVISVTTPGNEIASWKLKWKWDNVGLWGRGANWESLEYCSPGSIRSSCFDKTRRKLKLSDLMGNSGGSSNSWDHEWVLKWGNFIYALMIHASWVVKIYTLACIFIITVRGMLTYGMVM